MEKMVSFVFACAAAFLLLAPCGSACAAFAKPPPDAVKALKRTVGKPINAGAVFIEGRYVPPPYTVERSGTTLKINGIQAMGEVIPWTEFIKTQEGVVATKSQTEPSPFPSAPEPAAQAVEEEEEDDFDVNSSLDDLFDDDPKPKKKSAPKKKKPQARPKPRKPKVTISYTFDGEFVHNEKTRMYVDKINAARTAVDKRLRAGGCCFFGPKYRLFHLEMLPAKTFMGKIPEIMKDNPSLPAFEQALRVAGYQYLPQSCIAELFKNRYTYPQLMERRKTLDEKEKWSRLMSR